MLAQDHAQHGADPGQDLLNASTVRVYTNINAALTADGLFARA